MEETLDNPVERKHPVISAWKGLEPLWKAYWIYFVVGNIAINNLADFVLSTGNFYALVGYLIFIVAYLIWAITSVWRCAFNTEKKYWGYIARAIVVIGPVAGIVNEIYS
jgi:hypothetical protein